MATREEILDRIKEIMWPTGADADTQWDAIGITEDIGVMMDRELPGWRTPMIDVYCDVEGPFHQGATRWSTQPRAEYVRLGGEFSEDNPDSGFLSCEKWPREWHTT